MPMFVKHEDPAAAQPDQQPQAEAAEGSEVEASAEEVTTEAASEPPPKEAKPKRRRRRRNKKE